MKSLQRDNIINAVAIQSLLAVVIASFLFLLGRVEAVSGLVGGLTAAISNMIFAFVVFRRRRIKEAQKLLGSYYAGEALKVVFVLAVFLLAILYIEQVSILSLLSVYFVVTVALPVLIVFLGRNKKKS